MTELKPKSEMKDNKNKIRLIEIAGKLIRLARLSHQEVVLGITKVIDEYKLQPEFKEDAVIEYTLNSFESQFRSRMEKKPGIDEIVFAAFVRTILRNARMVDDPAELHNLIEEMMGLVPLTDAYRKEIFAMLASRTQKIHSGSDQIVSFDSFNPFIAMYPKSSDATGKDLVQYIQQAKTRFTSIGTTRGYYLKNEQLRSVILERACEIPIHIFVMDPSSIAFKERYRIEPESAAFGNDVNRFRLFTQYKKMLREFQENNKTNPNAGLHFYYYDFSCQFGMELIDDDLCRVMFYGHFLQGTNGPLFEFRKDSLYFDYFKKQVNIFENLITKDPPVEWITEPKKLVIRELSRDETDYPSISNQNAG